MTRHPALPGYIAIALALLFPAYWIPMLSSGLESFADAYRTDVMQLSAMDLLFVAIGVMEIYIYLSLRRLFQERIDGTLPATLLLLMAITVGVFHATVLFDVVLSVGPTLDEPMRERLVAASAVVMVAALFVYAVLGLVLSIVLLSRRAALPRLLKVFAVLLAVACVLQLTVVGGLLNVVLFPLILSVLAVLFIRGDHEVEVV
jgi:hypothetical protein